MPKQHVNSCRLGLCCQFIDEPTVQFSTTTARYVSTLSDDARRDKLLDLCHRNAEALHAALTACSRLGIHAFRVKSGLQPLSTHPDFGYELSSLRTETLREIDACGIFARDNGIRLSFHPDQFILLGSANETIIQASLRDLEQHAELAVILGADTITIHAGGGYGDKSAALQRVRRNLNRLSDEVRCRLTVENDDRIFSPADLFTFCRLEGVPLTYDVHHHRCHPDQFEIEEATFLAQGTWNREPLFHVSSPKEGWDGPRPQCHADYIDDGDFPACWRNLPITVDVEAKAKQRAVLRLAVALADPQSEHRPTAMTLQD